MSPLTSTTLSDNTDTSTCIGGAITSYLGPPCDSLFILDVSWASHHPGESQWSPCPPYLLSFSPYPALKLSPSISPSFCINVLIIFHFTCPLLPSCIFPFPAPSPSIFAFFETIYGCPLLLVPFPTFPHHIWLFSHTPYPLHDSLHPLAHPLLKGNKYLNSMGTKPQRSFQKFIDILWCIFNLS